MYKNSLPFFSKWSLDKPNNRSSHILPTPTGGGVIFLFIGTLGAAILGNLTYLLFIKSRKAL